MTSLYESMVSALREHWKTNNNAYPQCFELTQSAVDALVEHRKLINTSMNFPKRTSLGEDFLGVPIVVSAARNVMVAVDGTTISLNA